MLCFISLNLAVNTIVSDVSIEQHFTSSMLVLSSLKHTFDRIGYIFINTYEYIIYNLHKTNKNFNQIIYI